MNRESRIKHPDPVIEQLKAARQQRGPSMQQLAEQIGRRTYQAIWQWESLTHDPTLANLRQWADALGYDLALVPRDSRITTAVDAGRAPETGEGHVS